MLLALLLLEGVQDRMEEIRNRDRGEEESDQEEGADGHLFYLD